MTIHVNTDANDNVNIHIEPDVSQQASIHVTPSGGSLRSIGATPLFGPKGDKGDKGDPGEAGTNGRGISEILKGSTVGLVDTYTIVYTDDTNTTYEVTNGKDGTNGTDGQDGADGVGIASIEKTSTSGLVDTYTITYTDSDTDTFTVTNGEKGDTGNTGATGADGYSPTATVTKSGSVATISITDANGTTTETVSDGLIQDVKVDDVSVVSGSTANIDLTGYAKLASANTFTSAANVFRNILQIQSNSSSTYPYLYLHTPNTQHACLRLNNVNGYLESVTGNQSAYNPIYAGYSSDINSVITTVLNYQYDIGSASNYCKLGNGWMFQIGYHAATTSHAITFPKSFTSTSSYIAWAQQRSGTAGTIKVTCDAANKSTFTLSQSGSIIWMAIGW